MLALRAIVAVFSAIFRTRADLMVENLALRQQLNVLRRECTDHVIVFNENHQRRLLQSYIRYYHRSRTHLSLEQNAPEPRSVEPPENGQFVEFPEVGGLHHRYARRAA